MARIQTGSHSSAVLFAAPHHLTTLQYRGYLTLMDSTHGINWLGWSLYTVMVREECGK